MPGTANLYDLSNKVYVNGWYFNGNEDEEVPGKDDEDIIEVPGIPEGRTAKLADKTTGVVLKEGRYDAGAKISGVYENGNEVTYKITVTNTGSANLYDLRLTDVLSKELEEALEKDSVSFIEQVYTSKDNRKVRTKLEESQKLWMDFLAAGDAVDVYLKGKVRIDVGNLFSLENIVNLTARYKKGDEKARKEQDETGKEETSTEKKEETSKDDEAEKEEDKNDDQKDDQKDDQEGTKVPEKELEPLSKESKKSIEEAYEAIQKLTVEELQEESKQYAEIPVTELMQDEDYINIPGTPLAKIAKLADKTQGVTLVKGRYEGQKEEGIYEYGDTVDYTITLTNAGTADLYNLLVDDTLDKKLLSILKSDSITITTGQVTTKMGDTIQVRTAEKDEDIGKDSESITKQLESRSVVFVYLKCGVSVAIHLKGIIQSGANRDTGLNNMVHLVAQYKTVNENGENDENYVEDTPEMTDNDTVGIGTPDILAAKKADKVYLATDPDREGEAISWHLSKALKLEGKDVNRISFNEITQSAVKASLKQPRDIDMNLVNAQQARRILDRMVGYKISPLLWAKVKRGLSAGRVQSVALRIICDREEEINAFIPEEYWTLDAELKIAGEKKPLLAKFYGDSESKMNISSREEMDRVMAEISKETFKVIEVKKGERVKKAPLPFTTSTLQQEASKALNFPISKTMRIAQQLYEGVDVKGQGTVGLITYLRTDSVRISEEADAQAHEYIGKNYGENYLATQTTAKKSGAKIQDAHEAIRPSDINRTPAMVKDSLSRDQFRLYQLIWKRFAASRMASAVYETTNVKIGAGNYRFTVSASKIAFDGFMSVYTSEDDEKAENNVLLKSIDESTELSLEKLDEKQHFTQPPAHYTEASLVKTLEELGIGRPSTYSPTITTILARRYIVKENKNIYVTELGEVVNQIMKESFPSIVDEHFTANMESLLDSVGEGTVNWKTVIENFYPDLEKAVEAAEKDLEKVKIEDEVTDVVCDVCGRNMVVKYGPHGKFLACPGFPECRNTKPYLEKIGVKCPKCGKEIVLKKTKKGRKYYGCENNPECDFMSWSRPVEEKCPKCGGYMVMKGSKIVCADEQCGYVTEKKEKNQE